SVSCFSYPGLGHVQARCAAVRTPCASVSARVGPGAPPQSRDASAKGYRTAPLTLYDIAPSAGNPPIGHMGYFRSESQPFWDEALDWLLSAGNQAAGQSVSAALR